MLGSETIYGASVSWVLMVAMHCGTTGLCDVPWKCCRRRSRPPALYRARKRDQYRCVSFGRLTTVRDVEFVGLQMASLLAGF